MTITSKGQVTLPKEIRERLGVRPGDSVFFHQTSSGSVAVSGVPQKISSAYFGSLKSSKPYTPMEQVRRETAKKLALKYQA